MKKRQSSLNGQNTSSGISCLLCCSIIHPRGCTCAINKIKVEFYHWQREDGAGEAGLLLFPVTASAVCTHSPCTLPSFTQPGTCLLAHCAHQTRAAHATAKHPFTPRRTPAYLKWACHWDLVWFNCTESRVQSCTAQVNLCYFIKCKHTDSQTHTKHVKSALIMSLVNTLSGWPARPYGGW